jgi:KUP system potassium uptake protein
MTVTTLLAFLTERHRWKWKLPLALAFSAPFFVIDLTFLAANAMKIPAGGWLPLTIGALLLVVMLTWMRGTALLHAKARRDSLPLDDMIGIVSARPPHRTPGTAIFLTSEADLAPVALMHNLKHNKVLHERNIILTVKTAETPRVRKDERFYIERLNEDFSKATLTFGFMETPNVPKALASMRQVVKFDIMSTSFFLGRRTVVSRPLEVGMPAWQDKLFIFLMRNAENPTDFFHIPPGRVVELGTQVAV